VARRFRGESLQKLDAKGRVSVPARFRRVIEACDPDWTDGLRPQLVIVYGGPRQHHLECYTMEAIDEIDRRIDAMARGSTARKALEWHFHGQSLPTEIDPDGRLILPQKLREKIGLADEAYFIASGDSFRIWNPGTYQREEAARIQAWLDSQPEDFDPLSLLDAAPEG